MRTRKKMDPNNLIKHFKEIIEFKKSESYNSTKDDGKILVPIELQKYIQNTRHEKQNPQLQTFYYDAILLHVNNVLAKYDTKVNFYTTYSLNRRTETLKINNTYYIIHDQYLGKAFNLFNKSFLQLKDPNAIKSFCIRYLVEQFRIKGLGLEASLMLGAGIKLKIFEDLNDAYSSKKSCPEYAFIQELFIVLHEISHIIIKDKKRIKEFRKKEILEFIKATPFSLFGDENIPEVKFELNKKRQENLIEEIICDYIATKYTFELLFKFKLLDSDSFVNAINLGLRTMRSINMLNGFVEAYIKKKNNETSYNLSQLFYESAIRFYAIRKTLRSIIGSKYKSYFTEDPIIKTLENFEDSEKFYEDPLFYAQSIIDDMEKMLRKKPMEMTYADQIEFLNYIDQSLAWRVKNHPA